MVELNNPFIRGGGVQKIIDTDIENLLKDLKEKNFRLETKIQINKLSCKSIRVQNLLFNKLSEIFQDTRVSTIKISPTEINKFIRFKSISGIVEGLQELERIGFIKCKKEGATGKVREYWFNPFFFFIGTPQLFLDLFSQDIKIYYPQLYVKYCMS